MPLLFTTYIKADQWVKQLRSYLFSATSQYFQLLKKQEKIQTFTDRITVYTPK